MMPRIEAMTEVLACIRYSQIANNTTALLYRYARLGSRLSNSVDES
jgi:hypothetical protein